MSDEDFTAVITIPDTQRAGDKVLYEIKIEVVIYLNLSAISELNLLSLSPPPGGHHFVEVLSPLQ